MSPSHRLWSSAATVTSPSIGPHARRHCLVLARVALDIPGEYSGLRLSCLGHPPSCWRSKGAFTSSARLRRDDHPDSCPLRADRGSSLRSDCKDDARGRLWHCTRAIFRLRASTKKACAAHLRPSRLLRPAMVGIAVLLAAVSIGYWAMLVYLPPFLSASLGVSADTGGIVMLAATLPMLFVPPLGGRIVPALGWRWYFTLALAIMTIGSAGFVAALTANGTPNQWPVILAMIVVGLGAALAHPQLSGVVVALVPSEQAGMASAVTIVMRQAGFAVGIAAFGALLSSSDRAVAYFWPFVGTGLACALGTLAAVILLPPRLPES